MDILSNYSELCCDVASEDWNKAIEKPAKFSLDVRYKT